MSLRIPDLCGNRLMSGFNITWGYFDYGYSIGICVEKNRRYAFLFKAHRHMTVQLRRNIRRTLETSKQISARRYVPKKAKRRSGMVIRKVAA